MSYQNDVKVSGFGQNVNEIKTEMSILVENLYNICPNSDELLNYIIVCAYQKNITRAYHVLWNGFSEVLFKRLISKNGNIVSIPYLCEYGEGKYLGSSYGTREVAIDE